MCYNMMNEKNQMSIFLNAWLEHYMDVLNGKKRPVDNLEKELTDASRCFFNNTCDDKDALKIALQHVENAKKYLEESLFKDVYSDIIVDLEKKLKIELDKLN